MNLKEINFGKIKWYGKISKEISTKSANNDITLCLGKDDNYVSITLRNGIKEKITEMDYIIIGILKDSLIFDGAGKYAGVKLCRKANNKDTWYAKIRAQEVIEWTKNHQGSKSKNYTAYGIDGMIYIDGTVK